MLNRANLDVVTESLILPNELPSNIIQVCKFVTEKIIHARIGYLWGIF